MTVVSDTSTLNYLILIGSDELLIDLFGTIAVPAAVIGELQSPHAPTEIHKWLAHKPDWIEVQQLKIPENYLPDRGLGEREATYLATKVHLARKIEFLFARSVSPIGRNLKTRSVSPIGRN